MKEVRLLCLVVLILLGACEKRKENNLEISTYDSSDSLEVIKNESYSMGKEFNSNLELTEERFKLLLSQENIRDFEYLGEYELKKDSINVILAFGDINTNSKFFKLEFFISKKKIGNINGVAETVLIDDSDGNIYAPEGSFIIDKNTNKQYICDSTFMYNSENISISFSLERNNKERLSLVIYKSKILDIKDEDYTLYRK